MNRQAMAGGVAALCAAGMLQAAPLNEKEARIIKSRLTPAPQSVTLTDGPDVVLDKTLKVTLACAKDGPLAVKQTAETFAAWFGVKPDLRAVTSDRAPQKADAYRMTASKGTLAIEAADAGGARNALRTLRQLAEPVRGTREVTAHFVPELVIDDAPAMAFRGFHICWFPENTPVQIERFIRLAAYYKMNRVVLEPWGTFVSEAHPELAWPGSTMTKMEIRRLVKIAEGLGVTLIPQFNLFGHASGSRGCSGKHTILDFHPELQPLFEPFGWTWCLSNPETAKLIEEVVVELHEAFGRPPYFHAGCDEAGDMATCQACRRSDYAAVVQKFLARIHGTLAGRGCKMMIWHDMLLQAGDPRWKGFYANGSNQAEVMLDALPRDIIICDWYYGAPNKEGAWPTLRYFKAKGFPVLACPWEDLAGYRGLSVAVQKENLDGMLCTAWHHLYGNNMMQIYFRAAHATWGTLPTGGYERLAFAQHLRQVGWDVPVKTYGDTGTFNSQLPEKTATPQ
ncbi:MAG: family 20 glycosylhydrolase [Kiritimatiellae bacterium]|nr:family 20 glycosylhydrolase [Kiritimatiellia bacterium]